MTVCKRPVSPRTATPKQKPAYTPRATLGDAIKGLNSPHHAESHTPN